MKAVLRTVLVIALLALCAGCTSAQSLDGAEREAVLSFSEPMTDNLLLALNAGDYTLFARDLDGAMLAAFDEAGFEDMRTQIVGKIGDYLSREVTSVSLAQGFYVVIYTARFEQDEPVTIRVVFTQTEPHLISGLWFDSAGLRQK